MRYICITLLILILLSFDSYCQPNLKKEKNILLLKYNENVQCQVIVVDSIEIEPEIDKWDYCSEPIVIDDFSEYYYNTKVFFAQTTLNLNEKSKFIFWEYGYIKEVDILPFSRSKIEIESITNDTSILIRYANKSIILNPFKVLIDSIIDMEYHEDTIKYTKTIFKLENIGLLNEKSIVDLNKVKFDNTGKLLVNLSTNNIISRYNGDPDSLFSFIYSNLKYPDGIDRKQIKGSVIVNLVIDYKGNIIDIKINEGINPVFDQEIIEVIKKTKWLPSEYNRDFAFGIPLKF